MKFNGGFIPGQAKVEGDSEKNDTISIKVSPGEIVVPRTVVDQGPLAVAKFTMNAVSTHKRKLADGGKPEKSIWDAIKESFDEDAPKNNNPAPKLDPKKAKEFSSVYNTDKYSNGGVVSGFDPDKFLAETDPNKKFDPDKFLAETAPPVQESIGEQIARGALNTLPMAGMAIGGMAGMGLGPGTAVIGAGLGGGAGESLKQMGEKYLLGDSKDKNQYLKDVGMAIPNGMAAEMGGQSIGAIPGLIKNGLIGAKDSLVSKMGMNGEFTPVENQKEVQDALNNLGIKDAPKALMTSNPTFQKMESGLSQSGSLPAKPVRQTYNEFFDQLKKASEKVSGLQDTQSDFAIGKSIQDGLTNHVNDMRAPVSEMYQDLQPHLKNVSVDDSVVSKAFGALKRDPMFQTQDAKKLLQEYKEIASSYNDVASLAEWRSTILHDLPRDATPAMEARLKKIYNTVTSIRDNSIHALKSELPESAHGEVDNLIDQVKLADSSHASNISDVNKIKGLVGNKDFSSPISFIDRLGEQKESDLANRAANLDIGTMRNLQDMNPAVFGQAKQAKINDMIHRATNPVSGFNEANFIKQYDGIDQELKDLLFEPSMQKHIESLKTIKQSIPPKLGPSGTPEGQMMMDAFNPKRNALDYMNKSALDSASAGNPKLFGELDPQKMIDGDNILPFKRNPSPIINPSIQSAMPKAPMSMPTAAKNDNNGSKFLDMFTSNPKLLDQIKDPKLKDAVQKHIDQNKDPRESFIQGN